jgi:hypothetical protein
MDKDTIIEHNKEALGLTACQLANQALFEVQKSLNAPKNQYNSFGKYNYRSCEDILEGLKKVLPYGATVVLKDDIKIAGDRYYIEATAIFTYQGVSIESKAFAREASEKKGMDCSQISGCTSSYARKYALNGLFCIDDSKDNDTNENISETKQREQKYNNQSKKQTDKIHHKPTLSEEIIKDLAAQITRLFNDQAVMQAAELIAELAPGDKKEMCKHLHEEVIKWLKTLSSNPIKKD